MDEWMGRWVGGYLGGSLVLFICFFGFNWEKDSLDGVFFLRWRRGGGWIWWRVGGKGKGENAARLFVSFVLLLSSPPLLSLPSSSPSPPSLSSPSLPYQSILTKTPYTYIYKNTKYHLPITFLSISYLISHISYFLPFCLSTPFIQLHQDD